ncbi:MULTISPECIES: 3-keto-5-aminohexanoate cleavage protein [unclassified Streptomyces]|uniref:3-keto-5-aminohexanoate cleavage protein n=1 Tax=unclassified Streptomyces TaxID=2593676 RepID=UPI0023654E22|nr:MULTISPECIES: 3-keto-5-aminohexanoate cleavage protein [unclassified Streptomyces]MDF3141917.1 3-keto-5-aminohexanoate cleavage protein [Streptomyces sp. T21Q-yed]WDF36936.1 3-keto-5-aminohexanoate cleavage protein [Streptomyces sp. T12]
MIQVCLNGPRGAGDGAVVPLSPEALADSAAEAVAAGATDIHVHPKTPCGQDSLSPRVLAPTLEAIRARVPVPVGVTTGAWAEPDAADRVARIRSWTVLPVLPDHASVNWHEPGAEEVAAALLERGVGVEAGIWSGTDGAARFAVSPLGPKVLRVLAEVRDTSAKTAEESAHALLTDLGAAFGRPVLLHGEDAGAWPVLRLAGRLGLATRIGLEDTLVLPDGERAGSNAQLVAEGLYQYGWAQRSS